MATRKKVDQVVEDPGAVAPVSTEAPTAFSNSGKAKPPAKPRASRKKVASSEAVAPAEVAAATTDPVVDAVAPVASPAKAWAPEKKLARKMPAEAYEKDTTDFGVPVEMDPHQFLVLIPKGNTQPVMISESLGIEGRGSSTTLIDRCELERKRWTLVQAAVERTFNMRLKAHKLRTSKWSVGCNGVDRLLGKELCMLAWAIEDIPLESVPVALNNWLALRPEERWWLFNMAARGASSLTDSGRGWRKALGVALADAIDDDRAVTSLI